MSEKNEKEGTLEWYLEMSDAQFIKEMGRFERGLNEEEEK